MWIKWNNDKQKFLLENYKKHSKAYIARMLGVSIDTIRLKLLQNGLMEKGPTPASHHWTEEELKYLRENFHNHTDNDLSLHLGISKGLIRKQVTRMKLYKDKEFISKVLSDIKKKKKQ